MRLRLHTPNDDDDDGHHQSWGGARPVTVNENISFSLTTVFVIVIVNERNSGAHAASYSCRAVTDEAATTWIIVERPRRAASRLTGLFLSRVVIVHPHEQAAQLRYVQPSSATSPVWPLSLGLRQVLRSEFDRVLWNFKTRRPI